MAYCWTYSKKRLLPNKELTLQREIRIMLLTITETTFRFANIARGKENKAWCQQVYKSKKRVEQVDSLFVDMGNILIGFVHPIRCMYFRCVG